MKRFAKHFSLLIVVAALTMLFGFSAEDNEDEEKLEYVSSNRCKMCHNLSSTGKYFDDWQSKKHYTTFFALEGDERKDPECLKCHTTGYGEEGGFDPKDFEPPFKSVEEIEKTANERKYIGEMLGVQCEACHGPGENHIKSKLRGDVVPVVHKKPPKEVCEKCHNDSNPHWDPERYELPNGETSGFYYEEAIKIISHDVEKDED